MKKCKEFEEISEMKVNNYVFESSFDTSNVSDMSYIFNKCLKLKEIQGIDKFNITYSINFMIFKNKN